MVYKCLFCNEYTCKYPCLCQQNENIETHTSTGNDLFEVDSKYDTWAKNIFKKLLDRRKK